MYHTFEFDDIHNHAKFLNGEDASQLGINVVLKRLDVNPCEIQLSRKGNCGEIVYGGKIKSAAHFEFVGR